MLAPFLSVQLPFVDVGLGGLTLKCSGVGLEVGAGSGGAVVLGLSFDKGTLFVAGEGVTHVVASVSGRGGAWRHQPRAHGGGSTAQHRACVWRPRLR